MSDNKNKLMPNPSHFVDQRADKIINSVRSISNTQKSFIDSIVNEHSHAYSQLKSTENTQDFVYHYGAYCVTRKILESVRLSWHIKYFDYAMYKKLERLYQQIVD